MKTWLQISDKLETGVNVVASEFAFGRSSDSHDNYHYFPDTTGTSYNKNQPIKFVRL